LSIFLIAYFSASFLDFALNLFFHRRKVIKNSTDTLRQNASTRYQNDMLRLAAIRSFMFFAQGLIITSTSAIKSFYWLRRGNVSSCNLFMAGAIFIYIIGLFGTYVMFTLGTKQYILSKNLEE
jgi:hypothetical protein